jgi:hypothetical protein
VDDLLTGVIDRARAATSGHLTYSFSSGPVGSTTPPRQLPTRDLWFDREDWIDRNRGTVPIEVMIHRRTYAFQYTETRQETGVIARDAVISAADAVASGGENLHPWFAGSFWTPQQLQYVERHRQEFRIAAETSLEGATCVVCELDVPAADVTPYLREPNSLLADGGRLRLYVAPQLGFGMPQIEISAPNGRTAVVYTARSWAELPGPVYFPRQIRKEVRRPNGSTFFEQIEIAPELIGQPIPESTFSLEIPVGTMVRDQRPGANGRRWRTTEPTTSEQLAEPAAAAERQNSSALAWAIGVLVIVAFCLVLAMGRRRLGRRAAHRS